MKFMFKARPLRSSRSEMEQCFYVFITEELRCKLYGYMRMSVCVCVYMLSKTERSLKVSFRNWNLSKKLMFFSDIPFVPQNYYGTFVQIMLLFCIFLIDNKGIKKKQSMAVFEFTPYIYCLPYYLSVKCLVCTSVHYIVHSKIPQWNK